MRRPWWSANSYQERRRYECTELVLPNESHPSLLMDRVHLALPRALPPDAPMWPGPALRKAEHLERADPGAWMVRRVAWILQHPLARCTWYARLAAVLPWPAIPAERIPRPAIPTRLPAVGIPTGIVLEHAALPLRRAGDYYSASAKWGRSGGHHHANLRWW